MTNQSLIDTVKSHLLLNKELYGAISAIVTTITGVIFGISTIITAVTANKLIDKQTKLIEAEQLPIITFRITDHGSDYDFGEVFKKVGVYNQGAPAKDYTVSVENKLIVFFLKKDLKGKWVNTEGSLFNLYNYSSYPETPSDSSPLISTIDAESGKLKLRKLENLLLSYGVKNLEYSRVEFTPGFCITVRYNDKFSEEHVEKKCSDRWVDYSPQNSQSSIPYDGQLPSIDLDNISPHQIHLESLRYTYGYRLREIIRKQATEIIKLDSRVQHSRDSGLEPTIDGTYK